VVSPSGGATEIIVVIQHLSQQKTMFRKKEHQMEDRIVNKIDGKRQIPTGWREV
jgi:hypothetical protein